MNHIFVDLFAETSSGTRKGISVTVLRALLLVCILGVVGAASSTDAATYYWDNTIPTSAGFGTASGTWNGATANWNTDSTGDGTAAGATTLNTNATTDAVNFGTNVVGGGLGSGTITVGTANSGNITFGSQSGEITLSGGSINLAATETITVNNASNTINSSLTGAATSLTKAGTGTLNLGGTNTIAGTITLGAGTLSFSGANTLGRVDVENGSSLKVTGGTTSLSSFFTIGSTSGNGSYEQTGGTFTASGGTYTSNNVGPSTFTMSAGTFNAGQFHLGVRGVGNANISGTAVLHMGSQFDMGLAGGTALSTYTQTGGTVDYTSGTAFIGNISTTTTAALDISGGTFTGVNSFILGVRGSSTMKVSNTATVTLSTLTIGYGTGTTTTSTSELTLGDGTNFTSGSSIATGTSGVLIVDRVGKNLVTGGSSGTADFKFNGGTLKAKSASFGSTFLQGLDSAQVQDKGGIIDNGGFAITVGQALAHGGVSATDGGLVFDGTSTTTLGGVNSYTGATAIRNGTVALSTGNDRLPTGTTLTLGHGVANTSGILKLDSRNQTLAGLMTAGTGTANRVVNGNATAATLTLNLSADNSFGGILGGAGANENNFALTKSGASKLTLSGTNTFTGLTTITNGTLLLTGTSNSGSYNIAGTLEIDGAHDMPTASFTGAGAIKKSGSGTLVWGGGAATFNLSSGALIDVQGGQLTGGSSANEVWTNNLSDLNVASGAIFDTVEANVRVDVLTGSGTIKSGYSGSGYANLTFGVDGGSGNFSGVLANSFAAGNFVKVGGGTQTLSGINTYTGTTTVNGGTLKLDLAARSGTITLGANSVGASGTLELYNTATGTDNTLLQNTSISGSGTVTKTGAGYLSLWSGSSFASYTGLIDVQAGTLAANNMGAGASAGSMTLNIASGATFDARYNSSLALDKLTGSGTLTHSYTDTLTVSVGNNNGSSTFDGIISNSGAALSLTKAGTGTLILNGNNNYTGITSVTSGTLLVNGTHTSGGAYSVSGGAILGGTGSTVSAVTINSNGTLAPGASIESLGMGVLSMLGTSTFALEINTSAITTDLANVTGGFSLAGANTVRLTIADLGTNVALALGTTFVFVDYSTTWNGGLFDLNGSNVLLDDEIFTFGANSYRISYNGVTDNSSDVVLQVVAVPEPSSLSMLLFGGVMLWYLGRKRTSA